MREVALELQAHGRPEPAKDVFERSLAWYLDRAQHTQGPRRDLARAYYDVGRWKQAQELFSEAASEEERPSAAFDHGYLQPHLDQGYLGVLAIRRDDHEAAAQIARALATMPQSYLFGINTYWRAAMAAMKDERASAVKLLRQAFAEGLPHEMFIHTDLHFESLRTYPPFQELTQPMG